MSDEVFDMIVDIEDLCEPSPLANAVNHRCAEIVAPPRSPPPVTQRIKGLDNGRNGPSIYVAADSVVLNIDNPNNPGRVSIVAPISLLVQCGILVR